jgi:hypothetical protein
MRRILGMVALVFAVVGSPRDARAWGDQGHRAVGELAFRLLSEPAQRALREALTDQGYDSLAEAATWPDTYARRFPEFDPMKPLHYVDVDPRAPGYDRERDCPTGCVVTALAQFMTLLESHDPPLSIGERRRTIYWVAHLMGDIHQPLHIAHPDNKGGVSTLVWFFDAKDKRNAHWVWDQGLIRQRPLTPPAGTDSEPPYRALADELMSSLKPDDRVRFSRTTDPVAIANEGLSLARRYAYLQAGDRVDVAYEKSRWPIVRAQLQKAGVRLAAVLEKALNP